MTAQIVKFKKNGGGVVCHTGVSDENYDLISALYHTLQDCETIESYAKDAERAKDSEVVKLFREFQEQDRVRAAKLQSLLVKRMNSKGRSAARHSCCS